MTRSSRKFINEVFDQWQSYPPAAPMDNPDPETEVSNELAVVVAPEPQASARPASPNRAIPERNPYAEPVSFRTWLMAGLRKDEPAAVITSVGILGGILVAGTALIWAVSAALSALG